MTSRLRPRTKEIIDPSYPLLEVNRESIQSIRKESFNYGLTDRHQLDVYYPTSPRTSFPLPDVKANRCPILLFLYGGGLTRGSRSGPSPPSDLVHANLGAYFASQGFITVIPDYRLAPSIVFPQGSEDVRDALIWTSEHAGELQVPGDPDSLFVLAHSAGGLHAAGLLLTPELLSSVECHVRIRGVVFVGVPFEISPERGDFFKVATTYYGNGNPALVKMKDPLGLLIRTPLGYVQGHLPAVYNLRAGSEPKQIARAVRTFTKALEAKGGNVVEGVLEGHDHLSPILALSSGSGEEWAEEMIEWMKSCYTSTLVKNTAVDNHEEGSGTT
ncbi:hypothetical protein D9611_001638 [Ephemerocybe angulata]|uniref:BD-FAE-like domain-containing protein n=1 Tax=Ephemerocybe angulata TaxID=980116 RepID=A0A8H5CJ28_9AGAR|nr:hypothetical protein D9611_001638 [Tulosesus angulatus]